MRILSISFKDDGIFDNNMISFESQNGDFLSTVVFAGINGSGKTTLLNNIYKAFKQLEKNDFISDVSSKIHLEIEISEEEKSLRPRLMYLPSEVRFYDINGHKKNENIPLAYCMDDKSTYDITSYIKSEFEREIFSNPSATVGESIDRVCEDINSIFSILDMDLLLVGMKDPKTKMPLFKNSYGAEFDINGLSSGEKQLFVRILSLKSLNPENCVILVDEPEISLHPSWQQRIIEVYQKIGHNNQLIIATHSPHVISSVRKESLKILSKNGTVHIIEGDRFDETYGVTADIIMLEIMGMKTLRHPYVQHKIDVLKDMVRKDMYQSTDFLKLYEDVTSTVGTLDQDILLINIEVARRKGEFDARH